MERSRWYFVILVNQIDKYPSKVFHFGVPLPDNANNVTGGSVTSEMHTNKNSITRI